MDEGKNTGDRERRKMRNGSGKKMVLGGEKCGRVKPERVGDRERIKQREIK